jgi:hypothetical protein
MKKLMVILITVVILAAMAVPAFADPRSQPPRNGHVVFDYPLVYCGGEIGVGDFWLWNHEEAFYRAKDQHDKDGNLVQRNEHVDGTDMIYREGNPDKMLSGTYHINLLAKWEPPATEEDDPISAHWVGIAWNINIPGHGVVYHDSDSFTYPEDRQAGLTVLDDVTLCEYFTS